MCGMTEREDRLAYRKQLTAALRPRGQIIVATFGMNGPQRCSGLPVNRYAAMSLLEEFGPEFRLVKSATIPHQTPAGSMQEFLYCRIERV